MAAPDQYFPRQLHIVIDTCSMGDKSFDAANRLIAFAQNNSEVFNDYKVVVPLQIGTENKNKLFVDFLQKEMEQRTTAPPKPFHVFFQKHADHILITETPSSQAYKFNYAIHAVKKLTAHPYLMNPILTQANKIAEGYGGNGIPEITEETLNTFFARISEAEKKLPPRYLDQRKHRNNAAKIPNEHQEIEILAALATPLFEKCSFAERCIMQALYSGELYETIAHDRLFEAFRFNKGDRAIEEYVFSTDQNAHPERVTIIVSEDKGLRKSIQRLRQKTSQSVFVVNRQGLIKAADALTAATETLEIPENTKSWVDKNPQKKHRLQQQETELLNQQDEQKWADRLVEVIRNGYWEERTKDKSEHWEKTPPPGGRNSP